MFVLLVGVVLGIIITHMGEGWRLFGYVTLTLSAVMFIRAYVAPKSSRSYALWQQAAVVCSGCAAGALLSVYYQDIYTMKRDTVLQCADVCAFHAVVVARPELTERGYRYTMQLESMNNETLSSTFAIVLMPQTHRYIYGDTLSFAATVSPFSPFQSDTGRTVQYDKIMQSKNMHVYLQATNIQQTGYVSSLTRLSVYATDMFIDALAVALPEPVSSLAQGITYGVHGALDDESETLFRTTGLSHITVFSGSNVAIVLAGIWFLTGAFPYAARVFISLGTLCVVLLGVGISPPTLRAGFMGGLYVIARSVGKSASGLSILAISVVCMLLLQPMSLMYDISFQLSVLAVGALMTIAVPIETRLREFVPQGIAGLIAMTLSVMLAVAPWTAYVFGTFSPSSFVANMLVVPLVPFALILALLCACVTLMIPVLIPAIAYPTEIFYSLIFKIAEMCAKLPYSSVELPLFHGLYVFLWYVVLTVWYLTAVKINASPLHHSGLNH